jgi:hypothetical protein
LITNGRYAIPKHDCPEAKISSPSIGLVLPGARNQFRGNFNYWQLSQEEAGRFIAKGRSGNAEISNDEYMQHS